MARKLRTQDSGLSTSSRVTQFILPILKREYPDANDASVLLERDVKYDYLIQTMDAVRSAEVTEPDAQSTTPGVQAANVRRMELFTNIAVGEAP